MIETVFSKSAYGSLKLAQNCGADKHSSASIGLVLSGRTNISPEELETLKADAELQAHRKSVRWKSGGCLLHRCRMEHG